MILLGIKHKDMELNFLTREDIGELVTLLLHERYSWLCQADSFIHPYKDRRRKDKSEAAKRRAESCIQKANYYCKLSNEFIKVFEELR